MPDLFSLPSELICALDDYTRLKLSMVCKYLYSLIPEYKPHITYPDYIAALDRRDFMYLYRHKDTASCYFGEEVNLPAYHLFVKYLRIHRYANLRYDGTYHRKSMSNDVLYGYEDTPAMVKMLDVVEDIRHIYTNAPELFNTLAIHAFKTRHPKAVEYAKINATREPSSYRNMVEYHLVKNKVWTNGMYEVSNGMHKVLYAYGYITIEDALATDCYDAVAIMSRDYPDAVMKYLHKQKPADKRYRLLDLAAQVRSPLVVMYINQTKRIPVPLMDIIRRYPTKDIIDALDTHPTAILRDLLRGMSCETKLSKYLCSRYGHRLCHESYITNNSNSMFIILQHVENVEPKVAMKIVAKHFNDYRILDKLFSIYPPLELDKTLMTNIIKCQLMKYFLSKDDFTVAMHFNT